MGRPFSDRFTGPTLDPTVWFPHYLPAWSSRTATAASYHLGEEGLVLDVPVDHPLWCPDDHDPPLRVSGIQSGNWSGPVGSPYGQQRFRDGLTVREQQPRFEGWLPSSGRVAITARMSLSPRSMAALWLSGFEDYADQLRCGEICVFEVFGRALGPADAPSAEVGVGISRSETRRCPTTSQHPGSRSMSLSSTPMPSSGVLTGRCSPWTTRSYDAAPARRRTRCS